MKSDRFFSRVLSWSEWKHEILKKYLHIWAFKLGSAHRRLAVVDACAGTGFYEDGNAGSPVLAARWNDEPVMQQRRCQLIVHACEAQEETAAALRRSLGPWMSMNPPRAHVYQGSYGDALPTILSATRSMPEFFFVDPYGFPRTEDIRPILSDRLRGPTEVLVRADPSMLARFSGWLRSRRRSDKAARTAASFRNLLQRLELDTAAIEAALEEDPWSAGPEKMELFGQYLGMYQRRFRFVQIIPIRAAFDAAPKYFLIHGTDSSHGAAYINDAVSTTEDSLYEKSERRRDDSIGQFSLLTPARPRMFSQSQLREEVLSTLEVSGSLRFIELRALLALRFGPEFRQKHHKAAVQDLERRGFVSYADSSLEDDTLIARTVKPASELAS